MNCPWYSVDFATATGPSSYIPYDGYAAALAGTAGFTSPAVMWGNVAADWNLDGSGIALEILFAAGQWYWVLRIVGNAFADGNGPYATADSALEAFLSSDVVPSGFCVEILCDPKSLAEAAKCFACIPKGKLREVIIYLLCEWLKKKDEPVVCEWWEAESNVSPLNFTGPFASFALAFAAIGPFPMLIWGSTYALENLDGSAAYVCIQYDVGSDGWIWSIGIVGTPVADSGTGYGTALNALAAAQASAFLPAGFCVS